MMGHTMIARHPKYPLKTAQHFTLTFFAAIKDGPCVQKEKKGWPLQQRPIKSTAKIALRSTQAEWASLP